MHVAVRNLPRSPDFGASGGKIDSDLPTTGTLSLIRRR